MVHEVVVIRRGFGGFAIFIDFDAVDFVGFFDGFHFFHCAGEADETRVEIAHIGFELFWGVTFWVDGDEQRLDLFLPLGQQV